MNSRLLPRDISHTSAPPLKCQGIKTKLIKFIAKSIAWDPKKNGRWIEPFVGTGSVALNLAPERALLCDTNPHIIRMLRDIQSGTINAHDAREELEKKGKLLSSKGDSYYYEIRDRFNKSPSSIDFLFLNRSCFNGVIRFNKSGFFNTPFGHKPHRFDASFLTRVSNQIAWAEKQMRDKDWIIECIDWRATLSKAKKNDFVYLDPPYIGRHADYYSQWNEEEAIDLAKETRALPCGYALSMWLENQYRSNQHIPDHWSGHAIRKASHFYHVGSSESLRNEMYEALVIRPGHETADGGVYQTKKPRSVDPQIALPI
jgi:DNA adenine methylase